MMPNAFNFTASPFDCLVPDEQRQVRDSVDIVYFRQAQIILDIGMVPSHLFIIIKGFVTQLDGDEVLATYGPDDSFDGRGLMAGKVGSRFVATQEVLAYQLARQTVGDLIASNTTFGALLFSDLGDKLSVLSHRRRQHELQSLTLSRVDEAFLRPAREVDSDTDIVSVVRLFQSWRTSNVLVRDSRSVPARVGIFTATALQRAILDGRPLSHLPVGELTNFSLITVQAGDTLGDAMAVMLRHRVHRVVVLQSEQRVGILEALDLFSFLANQSHLITVAIEDAQDLDGLSQAAARITRMIAVMFRNGSRVNLIAKLVQQLNARLFERAWHLIAPPDLVANSCLFVMGSEGRGEQLLKTDQDNGLILRPGYAAPDHLAALCERFAGALANFGYPPCPGHVMLTNPLWRQDAQAFGQMARQWLLLPGSDSLMNLAIFMDAHAVCGDSALLQTAQHGLHKLAADHDMLLSRFAAAMDSFGSSPGWWNRVLARSDAQAPLNLKKEGVFPLVHGVRSLALAHAVSETSTSARIAALVRQGQLAADLGDDLTESLHFFMGLKLKAGLAELDIGQAVSGVIDVSSLSSLDRDLLKDTLAVVKRFKTLLRLRFHLDGS